MVRPLAIVTGGGRGIGRGIVTELSKTHHVIATYRGNQQAAQSVPDPPSGPLAPGTKGLAKLVLASDAVTVFRVTRGFRVP
jgi:NAD(P)-dependent dehydrogenase (short-subunit alcohol dehydrogenase family)